MKDSTDEANPHLTGKETKAVNRTKVLVILVLIASALSMSLAAYYATAKSEQESFESSVSYYE